MDNLHTLSASYFTLFYHWSRGNLSIERFSPHPFQRLLIVCYAHLNFYPLTQLNCPSVCFSPFERRCSAMPFITQCPQPLCQKFMLVEDEFLGQEVKCLICKQPFQTAGDGEVGTASTTASKAPSTPPASAPKPSSAPPPTSRQTAPMPAPLPPRQPTPPAEPQMRIVPCPNGSCGVSLEIPAELKGQSVQCPSCNQIFTV